MEPAVTRNSPSPPAHLSPGEGGIASPASPVVREGPRPSLWPVTLAAGMTLLLFGFVSGLLFSAAGVALMAIAIGGWIGELRRE